MMGHLVHMNDHEHVVLIVLDQSNAFESDDHIDSQKS